MSAKPEGGRITWDFLLFFETLCLSLFENASNISFNKLHIGLLFEIKIKERNKIDLKSFLTPQMKLHKKFNKVKVYWIAQIPFINRKIGSEHSWILWKYFKVWLFISFKWWIVTPYMYLYVPSFLICFMRKFMTIHEFFCVFQDRIQPLNSSTWKVKECFIIVRYFPF